MIREDTMIYFPTNIPSLVLPNTERKKFLPPFRFIFTRRIACNPFAQQITPHPVNNPFEQVRSGSFVAHARNRSRANFQAFPRATLLDYSKSPASAQLNDDAERDDGVAFGPWWRRDASQSSSANHRASYVLAKRELAYEISVDPPNGARRAQACWRKVSCAHVAEDSLQLLVHPPAISDRIRCRLKDSFNRLSCERGDLQIRRTRIGT